MTNPESVLKTENHHVVVGVAFLASFQQMDYQHHCPYSYYPFVQTYRSSFFVGVWQPQTWQIDVKFSVSLVWSFSFSIIPSKEHPGLISFRMDWLDLLAVQGTLKSKF